MVDSPLFPSVTGHLLRRCHQISVAIFLDECAEFDITPLQFAVLNTLVIYGPRDQATIGGLAALDRTTVAHVIGKLEPRALVRRIQSNKDKRAKIVSATERGKRLIAKVLPVIDHVQTRTLAPLDPDEIIEFTRLLQKVAVGNNSLSRAPMRIKSQR